MKYLIFLIAMAIGSSSMAGSQTFNLKHNEAFTVNCPGGKLTGPIQNESSFVLKCQGGGTPPPKPEPTPPPATGCGQPHDSSQPLKLGQEGDPPPRLRLSAQPTIRHFCSTQYPRGTYLSVAPYSASSFKNLLMAVSTTPGKTDAGGVPRACFSGGQIGNISVAQSGSPNQACIIQNNVMYYVTLSVRTPTGKPSSCKGCMAILYNAKK